MVFTKGEQTMVSFWRFFQETKEKLENISLVFLSCNHFHPSDQQPRDSNTLKQLVEQFKRKLSQYF